MNCDVCEDGTLIRDTIDGEAAWVCQGCGNVTALTCEELIQNGPSWFTEKNSGEGAIPHGFKANRHKISSARRKGKDSIRRLCQNFGISKYLMEEMLQVYQRVYCRNLAAAAGAVVLVISRNSQEDCSGEVLTIRKVSSFLNIPINKIAAMIDPVNKLVVNQKTEKCHGAITNIPGLIRSIFTSAKFLDPFTGLDINDRIFNTSEKVIHLIINRSGKSLEPNFIAIAACYLVWQSCHYYQSKYLSTLPIIPMIKPDKMTSLTKFCEASNLTLNDMGCRSVQKTYLLVIRILMQLLEKMTWIQLSKQSAKKAVPQYLEQILEHQQLTCEIVLEEEEKTRKELEARTPKLKPVAPKVLTATEEAELNSPELSEKDIPEADLNRYIRSSSEVEALKRWIVPPSQ